MFKNKSKQRDTKEIEDVKKGKKKVQSTLGKKKETRRGIKGYYDRTLGTLDKVTRIYAYVGIAILLFTTSLFVESLINKNSGEIYEIYTDTDLNFRLAIPHGWQAAKPEVENVKEAVKEETKGKVAFDMYKHSLGREVVPIAILNSDSESKTFAEFATLSFRGSEKEFGYLKDLVKIKDDVQSLLSSSDNKKIEVYDVAETELDGGFNGILVKARAEYELEPVDYYVWYEPAGANLLTVTYGATGLKEKEMLENLKFIIGGIIYDQPTLGMSEEQEERYIKLVEEKQSEIEAQQFQEGTTGQTTTDILPTLPTWNVEDKEDEK